MYASPPIEVGQVLADKYQVEQVLGAGGMGVVVAARHLQLGERVAIKFLLPHALLDADTVARFEREARIAVKIKSEHVARTLDVGQLDTGSPYIVMEYLEGTDLSAMLKSDGPLPIERTVDYVLQACEALAEAHALGIVHRDLKPANLFVTHRADGSPCVKLLDFGISKLREDSTPGGSITHTHDTLGSPLYMSPEQLTASRDADHRSDIWSLGVIVYQLLGNQLPFDGTSLASVSVAILSKAVPPLRDARPDAPEGLVQAVEHALEKDVERRYQNLFELARALAPYGTSGAERSVAYVERVLGRSGRPAARERSHRVELGAGVQATLRLPSLALETGPVSSGAGDSMPSAAAPATIPRTTRTQKMAGSRRGLLLLSALAGVLSVAAMWTVLKRSSERQGVTDALRPQQVERSQARATEIVERQPEMAEPSSGTRTQAPESANSPSASEPSGPSPARTGRAVPERAKPRRVSRNAASRPAPPPRRERPRPAAARSQAPGRESSVPESPKPPEIDVFQHRR